MSAVHGSNHQSSSVFPPLLDRLLVQSLRRKANLRQPCGEVGWDLAISLQKTIFADQEAFRQNGALAVRTAQEKFVADFQNAKNRPSWLVDSLGALGVPFTKVENFVPPPDSSHGALFSRKIE